MWDWKKCRFLKYSTRVFGKGKDEREELFFDCTVKILGDCSYPIINSNGIIKCPVLAFVYLDNIKKKERIHTVYDVCKRR